ncbi:hypothetical protein [Arenimonas sp.]|uniref:hypothetical protein n=1 Tax=Arenimonas sp. TaxID=1872635 RepID=UPI0039E4D057
MAIAFAGRAKLRWFELLLVSLAALIQLGLLVMGWGDFNNVHGGAVALVFLFLLGAAVSLIELVMVFVSPSWYRLIWWLGVCAYTVLLVSLGSQYGG